MISQSTVLPTTTPLTPGSVPAQPAVASGQWSGVGTAIRSGVLPFLQSLHPGYLPTGSQPPEQWVETPAFAMGSGNGQGSGFLQGTELAARLVSAYTALPTEIGSLLGGLVSLSATARFAGDQLGASGSTAGSVPEPDLVDNSLGEPSANDKRKMEKEQQKSQQPVKDGVSTGKAAHPANSVSTAAVATLSLMAMDRFTGAAAVPSAGERGSPENPIPISSSSMFNKIGLESGYPPDAYYDQTGDMDGSGLNSHESLVFSGHYDGRNHTISHQTMCLFRELDNGIVENLQLVDARVLADDQHAAVVACEMLHTSRINHIKVANSSVTSRGHSLGSAGIITGFLNDQGRIANIAVDKCTVTTDGERVYAGIIAGLLFGGQADQVTVENSRITTRGDNAFGGIGVGELNMHGRVSHLTSVCNELETGGINASAGIGAGRVTLWGHLGPITAINSSVITQGEAADAGVGAGEITWGGVSNLTAVHCQAMTTGSEADAGIGVGSVDSKPVHHHLNNLALVNSQAVALGQQSRAGIAAGYQPENANFTGIRVLNAQVNHQNYSDANITADTLCASADQRFVSPDCQVNPVLSGKCSLPSAPMIAPVLPGTLLPPTPVGLSTGAITGISLGAAAFVLAGVAGACIYRHYHRGPSPAVTGNQQELGSLDSAAILSNTESFASDDL